MKIRQPNLKIFLSKIDGLENNIVPQVRKWANLWLKQQEAREAGSVIYWEADGVSKTTWFDQDDCNYYREQLEVELDRFREAISDIYDFQSEKGLVDVHANG